MTVRTHLTVKRSLLLRTILRKRQDLYMNVGQPLPLEGANAKAFDKIILLQCICVSYYILCHVKKILLNLFM